MFGPVLLHSKPMTRRQKAQKPIRVGPTRRESPRTSQNPPLLPPFLPSSRSLRAPSAISIPRSPLNSADSYLRNKTMSAGELACTYAVLILHDDGIPVTAEKIAALVKSANVSVESYWPGLFAKLAEKRNVGDLITNVGSGGGAAAVAVAAPAGGAAPAAAAPAAEEKKEEPKEESDDDMGFSLFD
ncbi:hypothetical protein EUGRSUZ_E00482 [Eucalyptus grandis]|uniref:Uncharacterized protein n=3 Tax=Eucalyptus grandis TaxID=71139 RepID=A0ACC3KRR7_EUCGR|nr:hypothetical protein EUGRSUZ_E00482 [Eucalyptus grandis]